MAPKKLPRAEGELLDLLVARGETSAADLRASLGRPLTLSAIRTMLSRLEAKGMVRRRLEGHRYLYAPCFTQRDELEAEIKRIGREYFSGSVRHVAITAIEMMERENAGANRHPGLGQKLPVGRGVTADLLRDW